MERKREKTDVWKSVDVEFPGGRLNLKLNQIGGNMGAQQGKDRSALGSGTTTSCIGIGGSGGSSGSSGACIVSSSSSSINPLGAGSTLRASRIKSRTPKDNRLVGSNIFTEHSGKS